MQYQNKISDIIEQLQDLHQVINSNFQQSIGAINFQAQIYQQFIKIFGKFSKNVNQLSQKINEQMGRWQSDEASVNTFQYFSNSLLRLSECSRKISQKNRNEIFDPLDVFGKNYQLVFQDMLNKFNDCIIVLTKNQQQLSKNKENYFQVCQKFEKFKQNQTNSIFKYEEINASQLQKYNSVIKKHAENMKLAENSYKKSIQKVNKQWLNIKSNINSIMVSMQYNEQSRIAFIRKSAQNSLKLLQQFNYAFDTSITQKLEESNNRMKNQYADSNEKMTAGIDKRLIQKLGLLGLLEINEEFISHEEIEKRKKQQNLEQDSKHLQQIFNKVTDHDKKIIEKMISNWFTEKITVQLNQPLIYTPTKTPRIKKNISYNHLDKSIQEKKLRADMSYRNLKAKPQKLNNMTIGAIISPRATRNEKINVISKTKHKKVSQYQLSLDACKEQILSFQPYSFYFVEILYQKIGAMSSFYLKVHEQTFLMILNFFVMISKSLNINSQFSIELLYKMIQISQRIIKKRPQTTLTGSGYPIQLLCQSYGKNCPTLHNIKTLQKVLKYIQKRKSNKKRINGNERTGVGQWAKGLLSAMTRKKQPQPLTDEQYFNCLQQMTNIMANLSLPNETCLPFLKQQVNNNQNKSSYQYLKGIVIAKKDQQQRHKLFYKIQIKSKKDEQLKRMKQSKRQAQNCILITARKGFFDKNDIYLRLVSRNLHKVHHEILHNLKTIQPKEKWLLLIPYKRQIKYKEMKKQVSEKSIAPHIEQIITLDVNRSLHLHGQYFNPTLLHSLLRTYAYFHKDISYCQGMNYIAGYIYIKMLNQQPTYRIFQYLMEVRFKELFLNEFKNLKIKMYQFERLLSIFHSEVSDHFKKQGITPQCYIVSWIITLFSSNYQYTMKSYLIDTLWQKFIIYGWRQFYRLVLWLISLHKVRLLQMTYDRALHYLGQIGRSKLFLTNQQQFKKQYGYNIQIEMQNYPVTDQMLQSFKKQFQLI